MRIGPDAIAWAHHGQTDSSRKAAARKSASGVKVSRGTHAGGADARATRRDYRLPKRRGITPPMGEKPNIIFAICVLVALLGCNKREKTTSGGGTMSGPGALVGAKAPSPQPSEKTALSAEAGPTPAPSPEPLVPDPTLDRPLTDRWQLSELADVGAAAPMTATGSGILLIDKENRLHLARRTGPGRFSPVDAPAESFSRYGRGPAIAGEHAYWVSSEGRLMRGTLRTGQAEIIAEEARFGARVSALIAQDRELVAFIKGHGDETYAYLWASGHAGAAPEELRLSPEGSTATSIDLVSGKPHPRALVLEGRSGMSPVHVRTLRVTHRRVNLDADHVVWVGPGAHALTELVSLDLEKGKTKALIATPRDITHFGLAQLTIDADAREVGGATWHPYPNGLDPAPVAAAHLCGSDYALFAIPSHDKPRAPQELRIAELKAQGLGQEDLVARSRAFNDVSLAATKYGAIISWTADKRTWALELGCPKSANTSR